MKIDFSKTITRVCVGVEDFWDRKESGMWGKKASFVCLFDFYIKEYEK